MTTSDDYAVHVVAKQLPGDRNSGGRQRVGAMFDAYRRLAPRVYLYGFGTDDDAAFAADARPSSLLRAPSAPRLAAKWSSPQLRAALGQRLRPGDVIHVDFPQMMVNLPRGSSATVVDFHNIESALMRQRSRTMPSPMRQAVRFDCFLLEQFEVRAAASAQLVSACSPSDTQWLAARAEREVALVPNGVHDAPVAAHAWPSARGALFVGSMDYLPNLEAAMFLVREVWPRVLKLDPKATLVLAGRHANKIQLPIGSPSVSILDSPKELTTAYAAARVAVAPLLSGGGTNIKVLEALAHGRPVVATSKGARGLDDVSDLITLANAPGDIAAAVVAAFDTPGADRRRIFERGRDLTWDRRVTPFVESVLSARRGQ